jgi:hypothetical protein
MDPQNNTWQTILKAVKLLKHFVVYGAERCVDHAWNAEREVFDRNNGQLQLLEVSLPIVLL